MKVSISNNLVVEGPRGIVDMIEQSAIIPNPEYERAVKERVWGVEETINVSYRPGPRSSKIILPRGMADVVISGLEKIGVEYDLTDDRRMSRTNARWDYLDMMRDYQREAVGDLSDRSQGVYEAPPGSGKTITAIGLMRHLRQRTIVIVDKINIASQWAHRIASTRRDHERMLLTIWSGSESVSLSSDPDIVIALQQTLHRQSPQSPIWDYFGMVILDECHHVPAQTYSQVIDRFTAHYRYGLSGTPERKKGMLPFVEAYIGPIVARTSRDYLRAGGYIKVPILKTVPTSYRFDYHPTGKDEKGRFRRNNWGKLISDIVRDPERLTLITDVIRQHSDRAILIPSRSVSQLQEIANYLYPHTAPVYLMTGANDVSARMQITAQIESLPKGKGCVLLTTLADEALDIPRLDTVFIVYPTSSASLLRQQIGRIERPHANKKDPLIVDFFDPRVSILASQHRTRRAKVYHPEGYRQGV